MTPLPSINKPSEKLDPKLKKKLSIICLGFSALIYNEWCNCRAGEKFVDEPNSFYAKNPQRNLGLF